MTSDPAARLKRSRRSPAAKIDVPGIVLALDTTPPAGLRDLRIGARARISRAEAADGANAPHVPDPARQAPCD